MTHVLEMASIAGLHFPAWVAWFISLGALGAGVERLWKKVIRPIAKLVKKGHETFERFDNYDERIGEIERNTKQLTRNSGSHMADAVYRIEAEQQAAGERLTTHIQKSEADHKQFMSEVSDVWKTLAARDTVKAALKTAEAIDSAKDEKGN